MSHFDDETAVSSNDGVLWHGEVNGNWNIGDNPNGGYLVAIVMKAIQAVADVHPDPLTVTVHYLRPGIADEACEVQVEKIRTGRTLTTVRATLSQQGKPRLEVLAGMGDLSTQGEHDRVLTLTRPELPPPQECPQRSGEQQGIHLPISNRLDVRIHPGEARAGDAGKAQVSGWIRFVDQHKPDTIAALLFVDAYPPSAFGLLGVVGWVPTLELTVHVRQQPAPGWMLGQFRAHDLADGRMIEDGLLWDSAGHLIAQSRQLALVRA